MRGSKRKSALRKTAASGGETRKGSAASAESQPAAAMDRVDLELILGIKAMSAADRGVISARAFGARGLWSVSSNH